MRKAYSLVLFLFAISGLVQGQFQVFDGETVILKAGYSYSMLLVIPENDSSFSIWANSQEFNGVDVYVNTDDSSCSRSNFSSFCWSEAYSRLYSIGTYNKGTIARMKVVTNKLTNDVGKVAFYIQRQVKVALGETSSLNFVQHTLNTFNTNIEASSGVFQLLFQNPGVIKKVRILSTTCNDQQSKGLDFTPFSFIVDVKRPCNVEYVIYSNSFYEMTSFTTVYKPTLILAPSNPLQTSNNNQFSQLLFSESQYLRVYPRISIDNLLEQFGYTAPMQLHLTLRGRSPNDQFSVFISSTELFPDMQKESDSSTMCFKKNTCSIRFDIGSGNSYKYYLMVMSTLFVAGIDYTLTPFPVAFPPQGIQTAYSDLKRYMEFDYTQNFPGIGAFYFTFIGLTSGDTASVYINKNGLPFTYSNSYNSKESQSQYQSTRVNVDSRQKISVSLIIDSFTSGYQIYYKYLPIHTFSKTETNFKIESPYGYQAGFTRFYSAQIPSYQNVASAGVIVRYSGKSAADQISAYFADGDCDLTRYLLQDSNNYCVRYTGYQELQRTSVISINKPIYFSMYMPMDLLNYQFSVVFNVKCVEGFILTAENTCVSRQAFE